METLVALSCEGTLVLMAHGNGAAPGVHSMGGRFYEMAADHFEAASLPADAEHPGCQIHCLVRRPPAESIRQILHSGAVSKEQALELAAEVRALTGGGDEGYASGGDGAAGARASAFCAGARLFG